MTNRLSAHNNYSVLVTEDFTSEEDWVPGEKVDKVVNAVNTGNTDAYVRLGFLDRLTTNVVDANGVATSATEKAIALGKLDRDATDYGKDVTATAAATALQTGYIVVKAGTAVTDGNNEVNAKTLQSTAGNGLYIFRREVEGTSASPVYAYSGYYYDGTKYYALLMDDLTGANDQTVKGFSATYKTTADGTPTVATADTSSVKLAAVETKESTDYKFTYSLVKDYDTESEAAAEFATATAIKVVASLDSGAGAKTTDDIVAYLVLNTDAKNNYIHVSDATALKEKTGYVATDNTGIGWFVYNAILQSGGTTAKPLIDSVVLDKDTNNAAFVDLEYDVNVILESVQAVNNGTDESKSYTNASVSGWGVTVNASTGALTKS